MRIDSMDASSKNPLIKQSFEIDSIKKDIKVEREDKKEKKNISVSEELQNKGNVISEKLIKEAVEETNKAVQDYNRRFEISVHEGTNNIMVKVIDTETNKVIKEIPPEKILDMIAKLWELAGLIVDERR